MSSCVGGQLGFPGGVDACAKARAKRSKVGGTAAANRILRPPTRNETSVACSSNRGARGPAAAPSGAYLASPKTG